LSRAVVVTGCAGFVGSHLSERLVAEGFRVRGIDAFTPYYDRADKEANLAGLAREPRFELLENDVTAAPLEQVLAGAAVVFHLAAQPGVRASFGLGFSDYVRDNVLATQRLFEAALAAGTARVVWASSSAVYGDAAVYPCREDATPPAPRSPYGVTKRTCEDLADVYRLRGLEAVALRYFTVYGPRQRPDMAMRRLCEALLGGDSFPIYGDGSQSRDFTHVDDAVEATLRAGDAARPAPVYNIGGGEEATLAEVISMLEFLAGRRLLLDRRGAQDGDVRRTGADTSLARSSLGWRPTVRLRDGLRSELDWVRARESLSRGTRPSATCGARRVAASAFARAGS
jgi:nucleoside-diphosphate-sugar epimerase